MNQFEIKKNWYEDIINKPLDVVKVRYLEQHPKSKEIIKEMSKGQLLTYIYFGIYDDIKSWEGIATIISACNQKDFRRLIKYIYQISLAPPNIIRIFIYTLSNIEKYRGGKKFYLELLRFKNTFEKKFKELLFEVGQQNYIDRLDIIELFRRLLFQ